MTLLLSAIAEAGQKIERRLKWPGVDIQLPPRAVICPIPDMSVTWCGGAVSASASVWVLKLNVREDANDKRSIYMSSHVDLILCGLITAELETEPQPTVVWS